MIAGWFFGWFLASGAWAQALQPVPTLSGHVVDTTGTLEAAQTQALEEKLAAFERDKGAQIVLLLVPTTQPEDIAAYANRVGNAWKIGRKEVGDGLLLVLAKNDRKLRIEVAKALEGAVPDLAAKQIIDEAITPHLRQGDFAGGLQAGADRLMARIAGEGLPAPGALSGAAADGIDWIEAGAILSFVVFFLVPVLGNLARHVFGRKLGALATSAGVAAVAGYLTAPLWIILLAAGLALVVALLTGGSGSSPSRGARGRAGRNARRSGAGGWSSGGGGWSSGSSSSSSSDSFSSGGGGDFGGGGASGDW